MKGLWWTGGDGWSIIHGLVEVRESEAEEGDGAMTSVLNCAKMCFISSEFSVSKVLGIMDVCSLFTSVIIVRT